MCTGKDQSPIIPGEVSQGASLWTFLPPDHQDHQRIPQHGGRTSTAWMKLNEIPAAERSHNTNVPWQDP